MDSTFADAIYDFDPKLREEVKGALLVCKPNEHTIGFRTEAQNLKSCCAIGKEKNLFFGALSPKLLGPTPDKLADIVYINDNTAIIKIQNFTYYSVYYITLQDQTVQLNLLKSLIE
ncbi:hypothetical protein [Dyadobacter sp. CY343]|uniref:hypothetical protein n=1 Tax=Dyadobacter sp. CY343 TaxID=2907299 RepID=UPI001F2192A7|nr:hypothetical protein [Dyadobacter sp. CY343]MCE7063396.1 hypothetical protein [Dyadobacter sp. CY343]